MLYGQLFRFLFCFFLSVVAVELMVTCDIGCCKIHTKQTVKEGPTDPKCSEKPNTKKSKKMLFGSNIIVKLAIYEIHIYTFDKRESCVIYVLKVSNVDNQTKTNKVVVISMYFHYMTLTQWCWGWFSFDKGEVMARMGFGKFVITLWMNTEQ